MNFLSRNIVAAFWALILGEVLAYITSQLEGMTPDYTMVGILAVVFCLISVNAINAITGSADPAKDKAEEK
ncbi:YjzD family protein [Limosilactobacillus kribbianus]|uniref:YjzD family protein n=1 Tax=Limosilactobacillus kribbianus TaxID=2982695 RepID=UPI002264F509|nr:YjzD family protein [Limosilactobacillus kribbianus]